MSQWVFGHTGVVSRVFHTDTADLHLGVFSSAKPEMSGWGVRGGWQVRKKKKTSRFISYQDGTRKFKFDFVNQKYNVIKLGSNPDLVEFQVLVVNTVRTRTRTSSLQFTLNSLVGLYFQVSAFLELVSVFVPAEGRTGIPGRLALQVEFVPLHQRLSPHQSKLWSRSWTQGKERRGEREGGGQLELGSVFFSFLSIKWRHTDTSVGDTQRSSGLKRRLSTIYRHTKTRLINLGEVGEEDADVQAPSSCYTAAVTGSWAAWVLKDEWIRHWLLS